MLASLGLPEIPTSRRRIDALAGRNNWRFIDRVGRGGGRLYAIADLPLAAREALAAHQLRLAEDMAPVRGRPSGTSYFDRNPDVADQVVAILATQRLSASVIRTMLAACFPDINPPSIRTLRRFIARQEDQRKSALSSLRSPDQYKGRYRLALGRADADATRAGAVWEIDTTKLDVMTVGGRKMVLGLIDRFSRRAAFMVDQSESGQSVRRFLIDTIRKWDCLPAAVMTDNGSGYINASIRSALEALGIEHRICPPGSPEKKPHIERLFGTFTRDRAELLDGYIGHNVAEAQELRARARKATGRALIVPTMTPEQVQQIIDAWVDGHYHLRVHGSLRMTPMEKWLSCPGPRIAAPPDDVLRLALSALVGTRTVGKRGIVWQGGRYWAPQLAGWMGREVIVRRDEDELGELFIFTPDHSFITVAQNHQRSGFSQQEFARLAREQQAAAEAQARAEIRAKQKRFGFDQARDALLRADAEAAGKLAYLPVPGIAAASPAIDSITAAVACDRERPDWNDASDTDDRVVALPTAPLARVIEADDVIARHDAGDPVDPGELRRAQRYRATSEYRAWSVAMPRTLASNTITQPRRGQT